MMSFPLVEQIERAFIKWVNRPDDYKEERWVLYKRMMVVAGLTGLVIWVITELYNVTNVALIAFGLLVVVIGSNQINKQKRKEWVQDWFRGQYNKWDILLHW